MGRCYVVVGYTSYGVVVTVHVFCLYVYGVAVVIVVIVNYIVVVECIVVAVVCVLCCCYV